jgi:hypothetical protein
VEVPVRSDAQPSKRVNTFAPSGFRRGCKDLHRIVQGKPDSATQVQEIAPLKLIVVAPVFCSVDNLPVTVDQSHAIRPGK